LNYTMEQKQYNNKLTQRLIDLAQTSGYTFDPSEFNFVQIRDRIRCYFKSYVQSRKKKGVAICNSDLKAKMFQNKHHDVTFHTKASSRSRWNPNVLMSSIYSQICNVHSNDAFISQ
jgi:hypothetical protein